jgi:H+/Cl- antiporter ClcA
LHEKTWVVAGAAAGLASAFNTPLGGIVYAIEELGVTQFHRIRTPLLSAVIVSGLVAQWWLGSYLFLGFPSLQNIGFIFLPGAILCGLVSGICGAMFGRGLLYFLNQRLKFLSVGHLTLITVACGICVATLNYFDSRSSGTGIEVIMSFLFQDQHSDFTLFALRVLATSLSYLSGAAGGIFFAIIGHWGSHWILSH